MSLQKLNDVEPVELVAATMEKIEHKMYDLLFKVQHEQYETLLQQRKDIELAGKLSEALQAISNHVMPIIRKV